MSVSPKVFCHNPTFYHMLHTFTCSFRDFLIRFFWKIFCNILFHLILCVDGVICTVWFNTASWSTRAPVSRRVNNSSLCFVWQSTPMKCASSPVTCWEPGQMPTSSLIFMGRTETPESASCGILTTLTSLSEGRWDVGVEESMNGRMEEFSWALFLRVCASHNIF